MDFAGKTALITGAARGIGRAIAETLSSRGANIVICDIDQDAVTKTAAELGVNAIGIKADVTKQAEIAVLVEKSLEKFGSIDILVNNAGITRDGLMVRMDEKDWDLVLDINLKGAFLVTKAVAKVMMKQRHGRIVNISSVVGVTGNAGQINYSASKAGLIGLTKTAAKELAARNITVNAVAPGFIETEMTAVLSDKARAYMLAKVALGRPGTPDDIAKSVAFFASDDASYVTGQVLGIDGGMS
jgi:3-oxoacyl-[acyl-carrier protein] reductase